MKQVTFTKIAILALNLDTQKEEEKALTDAGLKFKPLMGVYKGQSERSYLVPLTVHNTGLVFGLARKYNQESILISDIDRSTKLVYLKGHGSEESIGVLTHVSEGKAKSHDGYTYDPKSNQYWVAI